MQLIQVQELLLQQTLLLTSSGTTIVATFTLSVDGTYYIRIENNDGLAVRSGSALLTVSDVPAWVTASGSLGTFAGNAAISTHNFNSDRCDFICNNEQEQ